jgi:hypothetical protein
MARIQADYDPARSAFCIRGAMNTSFCSGWHDHECQLVSFDCTPQFIFDVVRLHHCFEAFVIEHCIDTLGCMPYIERIFGDALRLGAESGLRK